MTNFESSETYREWAARGACRGMSVDAFYVTSGMKYEGLRELCAGCPVIDNCYDHAIQHESEGFWAGTTENERVAIRREKNIRFVRPENFFDVSKSPCGTERGYDRHRRERRALGENGVTCEACKKAHSEYNVIKRRENGGRGARKQKVK